MISTSYTGETDRENSLAKERDGSEIEDHQNYPMEFSLCDNDRLPDLCGINGYNLVDYC